MLAKILTMTKATTNNSSSLLCLVFLRPIYKLRTAKLRFQAMTIPELQTSTNSPDDISESMSSSLSNFLWTIVDGPKFGNDKKEHYVHITISLMFQGYKVKNILTEPNSCLMVRSSFQSPLSFGAWQQGLGNGRSYLLHPIPMFYIVFHL